MAVEVVVVRTVAAAVSYTAVVGNTVVAVVESQAVEPGCKVEPPRGGGLLPPLVGALLVLSGSADPGSYSSCSSCSSSSAGMLGKWWFSVGVGEFSVKGLLCI